MSTLHCFFCGGKECKYENWKLWTNDHNHPNAIDGLFSNWITPSILAMQRPSTRIINEYQILNQFKQYSIAGVFNLQLHGEHASCGDGIDRNIGFSYDPQLLMDNNVSYFNFGWTDMETPTFKQILNIAQVMANTISEDKKVAVHCHAGLGRTGLAIACYLVFSQNMSAFDAITIVRSSRPLSVQTKKQLHFVIQFEEFLKSYFTIYPGICQMNEPHVHKFAMEKPVDEIYQQQSLRTTSDTEIKQSNPLLNTASFLYSTGASVVGGVVNSMPRSDSFSVSSGNELTKVIKHYSLKQIIQNQRVILHGIEERQLRYIPKIIFVTIERIKCLITTDIIKNSLIEQFVTFEGIPIYTEVFLKHLKNVNLANWDGLSKETNSAVLLNLLLFFIITLKLPFISKKHSEILIAISDDKKGCIETIPKATFHTINYILAFLRKLTDNQQNSHAMISRLAVLITCARSMIENCYKPRVICYEEIVTLNSCAGTSASLHQKLESTKAFKKASSSSSIFAMANFILRHDLPETASPSLTLLTKVNKPKEKSSNDIGSVMFTTAEILEYINDTFSCENIVEPVVTPSLIEQNHPDIGFCIKYLKQNENSTKHFDEDNEMIYIRTFDNELKKQTSIPQTHKKVTLETPPEYTPISSPGQRQRNKSRSPSRQENQCEPSVSIPEESLILL